MNINIKPIPLYELNKNGLLLYISRCRESQAISLEDMSKLELEKDSIITEMKEAVTEEAIRLFFDQFYKRSVPIVSDTSFNQFPIKDQTMSFFIHDRVMESGDSIPVNDNHFSNYYLSLREYLKNYKNSSNTLSKIIQEIEESVDKLFMERAEELKKEPANKLKKILKDDIMSDVLTNAKSLEDMETATDISDMINKNVRVIIQNTIDNAKHEKMAYQAALNEIKNNKDMVTEEEVNDIIAMVEYNRSPFGTDPFFESFVMKWGKKHKSTNNKEDKSDPMSNMINSYIKKDMELTNKSEKDNKSNQSKIKSELTVQKKHTNADNDIKDIKNIVDERDDLTKRWNDIAAKNRELLQKSMGSYNEEQDIPVIQEAVNEYVMWNIWNTFGLFENRLDTVDKLIDMNCI